MGVFRILGMSLQVYVANLWRLLGITVVVTAPLLYLYGWQCADTYLELDRPLFLVYAELWLGVLKAVFWLIAVGVCWTVLTTAALLGPVCRSEVGRSLGLPEPRGTFLASVVSAVMASVLTSVAIVVGFAFLLVPGIIFSVRFAFVGQVVAAEGLGPFKAMGRSRELARPRWDKVLGVLLVGAIVYYGAAMVSFVASGLVPRSAGNLLTSLASHAGPILVLPFISTCLILLYYDMLSVEQGWSRVLATAAGGPAPTAGPVADRVLPARVKRVAARRLAVAAALVAGFVVWRVVVAYKHAGPTEQVQQRSGQKPVTPLRAAIDKGDTKTVDLLLEAGAPLDIYTAAALGRTDYLKAALAKDPSAVNRTDGGWYEETALHKAAYHGQREAVEFLLSHGADVNAKDIDHATPLHEAVYAGHQEVVRILLAHGANVNAVVGGENSDYGRVHHKSDDTPLHLAARKGDVAMVKILLEHGANVKTKNAEGGEWLGPPRPGSGLSPLGVAVEKGHKEVADLLRQHGATR